jgi:AcrR family transcriptional regulator
MTLINVSGHCHYFFDDFLSQKGCDVKTEKTESPIRKKLLVKARTLFGQKGYSETTIKDIAIAYGCEPANIYNYFKSKESILYAVLYEETQSLVSKIRFLKDDHATSPILQIKTLFEVHGEVALGAMKPGKLIYDTELWRLSKNNQIKLIQMRDEYDAILRAIIKRGIAAGLFKKTDVSLAAYAIVSTIMRLRVWYKPKGRLSKNEIIRILWVFSLRALGCDEKHIANYSTAKPISAKLTLPKPNED